jgi:hypothetical protein
LFFPLIPFDMSVVENARGHAMRAVIIALMLTVATQAGADTIKELFGKEMFQD